MAWRGAGQGLRGLHTCTGVAEEGSEDTEVRLVWAADTVMEVGLIT